MEVRMGMHLLKIAKLLVDAHTAAKENHEIQLETQLISLLREVVMRMKAIDRESRAPVRLSRLSDSAP